jgi:rhodanese-related sulfurtransferase
MKQILFVPFVSFVFVGCVQKTITLPSHRPSSVTYEEPVVYHGNVVQYEEPTVISPGEVVQEVMPNEPVVVQPEPQPNPQPHYGESTVTPIYTPTPATTQTEVETSLEPITAYDMLQSNPMVTLLDVRTKQEQITDGKIANSLLIPLDVLPHNLNRLDRAKKILVYCHTGNRSKQALNLLLRNGFDAVEIKGGIQKWKAAHLPVRYGR